MIPACLLLAIVLAAPPEPIWEIKSALQRPPKPSGMAQITWSSAVQSTVLPTPPKPPGLFLQRLPVCQHQPKRVPNRTQELHLT